MAMGMPININPGETAYDLEEELARMREEAARASKPHWGDALIAMGSTLRSFGSGGRVPDRAPEILDAAARQRREDFQQRLEAQQREQALRYISKTGNPDLMAAFQGGMDPGDIIKFNFQEKMADKERAWALEDAETGHKRKLKEFEEQQRLQALYDPATQRQKLLDAQNARWRTDMGFPEPDTEPTVPVNDRIPPSETPGADLPPEVADASGEGIVTGFQFPQEPEVPTVHPITARMREISRTPDLSDADAFLLAQSPDKEAFQKTFLEIQQNRLRQAEIDKPVTVAPNTALVKPNTGKEIYKGEDAPPTIPADILTAKELRKDPGLMEIYLKMKNSASGKTTPDEQLWLTANEEYAKKVLPQLEQRGNDIASTEPQFQAMKALLETAPQGLNFDALAANYLPGYSGSADTLKSIIFNMAPKERVEGSGSTSDLEYAGMLKSFPQLMSMPGANKAIVSLIEAKRNIERDRATLVSEYRSGDISYKKMVTEIEKVNKRSITEGLPKEVKDLIRAEMGGGEKAKTEENSELNDALEAYPDD